MTDLSKTQIDRLGDRLRKGIISEADLKMLDDYRKSFGVVYGEVIRTIEDFNLKQTGRPAKSTTSIVDKLNRESIRLSQIQDMAGCRIVVENIQTQNKVVDRMRDAFSSLVVIDRRLKPSYGYRAVHLVIKIDTKLIEVQVRTLLQHEWAELSERFSDKIDPSIKYGGGIKIIQENLLSLSQHYENYEKLEADIFESSHEFSETTQNANLQKWRHKMEKLKREMIDLTKIKFKS